jgi:tRNA A37 N6-isopentenylltransferase MiaA
MSGIGYKQIAMFIQEDIDLTTATEQIKKETHRFARHQYAWFRLGDERIHWRNEYDNILRDADNLVSAFLGGINQ